jgi:hypothetical protein
MDDQDRPLGADDLGGCGDRAGLRLVDGQHRACAHESNCSGRSGQSQA